MDCDVARNAFARESFRDVADQDYIAARSAYRMGLMDHFLWSGLQAIEKYQKAFLLINKAKSTDLRHDLERGYKRASEVPDICFKLPERELGLLRHINRNGVNRYREICTYTKGDELQLLDSLVWHLRRYCQPLRTSLRMPDGTRKDLFEANLNQLNDPDILEHPYRFRLTSGYLEKVLARTARDLTRSNLVWGNRYFGPGKQQRWRRSHSQNAYLSRYPEEIDCLVNLVYFHKEHLTEIKELAAKKSAARLLHSKIPI